MFEIKQKGLNGFFEDFLKQESIFNNKAVLQSTYTPETIVHREKQIKQLANILAPCLKLERPSNLFIYGQSGTGKTVSAKYTTQRLMNVAKQNSILVRFVYVNCKLKRVADTEYRLIAQLSREFGNEVPATGLPTEEIYRKFIDSIDSKKQIIILVLDEIDQLVKKTGDEILYNLTRINEELKKAQISIVGVSNDLTFINNIDPRVKSSLSEEEISFPPYNALQIQDILSERAKKAFNEEALGEGVIEKCAAYAAREHGDARRALELLRVAGEIADRNSFKKLEVSHIDAAEEKIEKDRIIETVKTQPKHYQLTLYAIFSINLKKNVSVFTGEVYEFYKKLCTRIDLKPLTQRRLSDIIAELDMLGIINAKVISKGRGGRTREITLAVPSHINPKIKKILEGELEL